MKPLTREWVEKAEGDYASALRELRARKSPNYDAACFHSQQCVEKYIKACLQEAGIHIAKTHDLLLLHDALPRKIKPRLELMRQYMGVLTSYAIEFRYPGESADKALAADAVKMCKEIRKSIRGILGLTDV